jgi:hypothetical protein
MPGKALIYQIGDIFARLTLEVKIDNLTGCAIFSFQFISPSKEEERKHGQHPFDFFRRQKEPGPIRRNVVIGIQPEKGLSFPFSYL